MTFFCLKVLNEYALESGNFDITSIDPRFTDKYTNIFILQSDMTRMTYCALFLCLFCPFLPKNLEISKKSTIFASKNGGRMNNFIKILAIMATIMIGGAACNPENEAIEKQVYFPGDVVAESDIAEMGEDRFFVCKPIPDGIFALMQGKSFKADCTTKREDLRYITCLHRDKDGRAIVGEMVLNKSIADNVLWIFKELYKASYPIERMRLVDYWDADDEMAMRDNNSSSFNFRFISHTNIVSKHGLGTAVDINPLYNPYHKITANGVEVIEPATGKPYLDRTKQFDYKIEENDLCCRLFKEKGFEWGGDWTNRKDYQHFELP